MEMGSYVGIQVNLSPLSGEQSKSICQQLEYISNNLGDCYSSSECPLPNTMACERETVEIFATQLGLEVEECWGYIGGGSSLGNLQGMWIGKTLHPDATLVFSAAAHYSVYKFASLLGFKKICIVDATSYGQINTVDLQKKIYGETDIVAVLTAGTTMTGAFDPVDECIRILKNKAINFYFHLDAALGGAMVNFIDSSELKQNPNDFTFQNDSISSLTVSVHKIIGCSVPANVFICRNSVIDKFKNKVNSIPYLENIKDVTLYGSRDGFRVSLVHARLKDIGENSIQRIVNNSLENCRFLVEELCRSGVPAFRVPGGIAAVMPRSSLENGVCEDDLHDFVNKYHLVCDDAYYHVYVMEHVNRHICEEIISNIKHMKGVF